MKENRFKRNKRKLSLKKIVFAGLFFCLAGGAIYFVVWYDFFWIEEIEFKDSNFVPEGLSLIAQENLEKKLWRIIPQKSIILAPIKNIRNDILSSFPEIKEVMIYRKLPNILEITIEERKMIGIWCQVEESEQEEEIATSTEDAVIKNKERKIDKCFHIDKEGIIFKKSPLIKGSLILNIYGFKNSPAELRDNVASLEVMDFILKINDGLPKIKTAKGLFLKVNDFEIVSIEDLRVTSSNNLQIYFNPSYSVDSQLEALKMVLQEEIKEDYVFLEYIDLRIERRAYYKTDKVRPF